MRKKQLCAYCCLLCASLLLSCSSGGGGGGVSGQVPTVETMYSLTIIPPDNANLPYIPDQGTGSLEATTGGLYVYVQKYDLTAKKAYGPVQEFRVLDDGRIDVPLEEHEVYLFTLRGEDESGKKWEDKKVELAGNKNEWKSIDFRNTGITLGVNDPKPRIRISFGKEKPYCVGEPFQLTCQTKVAPMGGSGLIQSSLKFSEINVNPAPDEKVHKNAIWITEGYHVITVTPKAPGLYEYRCGATDNANYSNSEGVSFFATICGSPFPPTPPKIQLNKGDKLACSYSTVWRSYLNGTQVDTETVAGNYNLVAGDNNTLSGTLNGGVSINPNNGDLTPLPGYSQSISGTYDNNAQTVSIPVLNITGAPLGDLVSEGSKTVQITGSTTAGNYIATKEGTTYCSQQK